MAPPSCSTPRSVAVSHRNRCRKRICLMTQNMDWIYVYSLTSHRIYRRWEYSTIAWGQEHEEYDPIIESLKQGQISFDNVNISESSDFMWEEFRNKQVSPASYQLPEWRHKDLIPVQYSQVDMARKWGDSRDKTDTRPARGHTFLCSCCWQMTVD